MTWTTRPRSEAGDGLAAIAAGKGPLVILIHGVGLRAEAWNPQIDALSARFRVVAVDLPGHGGSPQAGAETLADHSARIARTLTAPAVVAGHSMGAMIAADLAERVPERVRGLACLNAVYRRDPDARAAVRDRAARLDGRTRPDPEPTLARWFGAEETEARRACRSWLGEVDPAAYRSAYRIFAAGDGPADRLLKRFARPALFMTGADEPNSTPAMARAMAALAPRGRAMVLPGAAHMMPMTHAGAVCDALLRFCRECHDDST